MPVPALFKESFVCGTKTVEIIVIQYVIPVFGLEEGLKLTTCGFDYYQSGKLTSPVIFHFAHVAVLAPKYFQSKLNLCSQKIKQQFAYIFCL